MELCHYSELLCDSGVGALLITRNCQAVIVVTFL